MTFYDQFTLERFNALKQKLTDFELNKFERVFIDAREQELPNQIALSLKIAEASLFDDPLVNEAHQKLILGYKLGASFPLIFKDLEETTLVQLINRFEKENTHIPRNELKSKVVKRQKILGFIPVPSETEYYNPDGEVVLTVLQNMELTEEVLNQFNTEKSWKKKIQIIKDHTQRTYRRKNSIQFSVISGKPTLKKLFHALVKLESSNHVSTTLAAKLNTSNQSEVPNAIQEFIPKQNKESMVDKSKRKKSTAFRKEQAFVIHYLFEAMGINQATSQANIIRFIEYLSGNENIEPNNSQFKRLYKGIGPDKISQDQALKVIELFENLDANKKNSMLQKAVQLIKNDMDT